jgi:AcrR family transcriptional regulator
MPDQDHANLTSERADATRERIVQAARELVIEHGYADVGMAEVQRRAGVSRGGLYHHFRGKQELMGAVIEAVEVDFQERLAAAVADAPDPFAALEIGLPWYLDECLQSQELQRIGLYEGRQALGWEFWRESVAPYGVSMLAAALQAAIDAGQLEPIDPEVLAYMILALLHEGATMILSAADPVAERARVGPAVASVLEGLRRRKP